MRAAIEWFRANGYAPQAQRDAHRAHSRPARRTQSHWCAAGSTNAARVSISGLIAMKISGLPPVPGPVSKPQPGPLLRSKKTLPSTWSFLSVGRALSRDDLAPGTAHNIAGVIDARTGERFRCDAGAGDLWLVTNPNVADDSEKRRLASTYCRRPGGYGGCGRCAAGRDARDSVLCIKGVSDGLTRQVARFQPVYRARWAVRDGRIRTLCAFAPMVLARTPPNGRK